MADDGIQSLVTNFVSVTGSDEERAKFYLNAANWDLNSAIAAFFDSDSGDTDIAEPVSVPTTNNKMSDDDTVKTSSSSEKSKGQSKRPSNQGSSKFATLSSYRKDDSSSDGEEGQRFYAGGSESSGQQIVGPNKKKKDKNLTQGIFDAAKMHGAEVVTGDEPRNEKRSNAFSGAGFTLGSNEDPSKQIGSSLAGAGTEGSKDSNKKSTTIIKFWQNGFSVDDGCLRDPNDPENADFMDSIKRGEVPKELRQVVRGNEVHVNMEDHRNEEYIKPKETVRAFAGAGYTLGSPSPNIVKQEEQSLGAPSVVPSRPTFKVDESKPCTTIQIRLADGTRLVTKFNTDNTVGDIRNVVQNAKPGQSNFKLMTTFPNKELVNNDETIEEAKLKNAVIVQRMA